MRADSHIFNEWGWYLSAQSESLLQISKATQKEESACSEEMSQNS